MAVSFLWIVSLLVVVAVVSAGTTNSKVGMTGDVYIFAQSWQPEFCYGKDNYVGCAAPKDYWTKYFTVHGMWPQYSTGGYPANCNTEAFDTNTPQAVGYEDMVTYWPNAQYAESDPSYDDFWEHEWSKHGTCTGLVQTDYFSDALNVHKQLGTPSLITNNVGGSVSAEELRNAYGGKTMVSLQCSAGVYINGVYTCWSASSNGKPGSRITCPADVQAEDTCTGATLIVNSFTAGKPYLRGGKAQQ